MARFEDLQQSLWDTGSDYGVQPPVTAEVILEAERLLNVTLPGSLLDLLRQQNGGRLTGSRNAFPTSGPTSWSADHVPVDSLLGIGHRERMISVLDSPYLIEEWDLPAPVVLVSGDGHCWIGLDYRSGGRHGAPPSPGSTLTTTRNRPSLRTFSPSSRASPPPTGSRA
ncbi:SMI1/KNR4 family protein [Streptomyces sp. NPDC005426]|uniref:SMI1/KNR4 family protein n=1 Tax=Streptomyces sp. NPDC005426 TaxID=3155344 RepID=UPI0033A33CF8